jgi:hypothetical protein
MGEQAVKILNPQELRIVGGGSLKTRLGGATLYSQCYDPNIRMLFLGDSIGNIHIFRRRELNIEFMTSMQLNTDSPILSIRISNKYQVICRGSIMFAVLDNYIPVF